VIEAESNPASETYLSAASGGDGLDRILGADVMNVPVPGGTICVRHVLPLGGSSSSLRPIVFVPGWGTIPESFGDFYSAVPADAEVFHVETREKPSSSIARRGSEFTMDQVAQDLGIVLEHLGLNSRSPVLMGTCFGSAVILHALATGVADAPTIVCVDPMERLWFPLWLINLLRPLMPSPILWLFRPPMRAIVLAGMKEPIQRKRAKDFIDSATIWKWRRAAISMRKWSFFDIGHLIRRRVYVVNGSHDRFHNSHMFPEVARAAREGVFVRIPVGESRRERLMGVTAGVFASHDATDTPPAQIAPFVS
jgi:hypothetical protein